MPEPIIHSPGGRPYHQIGSKVTTIHADTSPKNLHTTWSTIEVLVFDSRLISQTSQFGHVAIQVDGYVYSRAPSRFQKLTDPKEYRDGNQAFRDYVSLTLRINATEKERLMQEINRKLDEQLPYDLRTNSCSTTVAELLESIGILAHDPRFQFVPQSTTLVSPKEVLIMVSRSRRLVKRTEYKVLNQ